MLTVDLLERADSQLNGDERGLIISDPKFTKTLFTPQIRKYTTHPHVTLNKYLLPLEERPLILGVTLDSHFTFTLHIDAIITRALTHIIIFKAIAGTNWDQQKETILITNKYLIRFIYIYATPICLPNALSSSFRKVQTVQNSTSA